MLAAVVILAALTVVPPLTDAQRARLDSAVDDSHQLETEALYPLLENVLRWDEAGDTEAGARIPDYVLLLADPAGARGERFLIEGRFAGRDRRIRLSRAGEWGDGLTEWVLLVRDEPEEVAVVYFVDPEGAIRPPVAGAQVRAVGRFYKVWADTDQAGVPTRYLTFIAKSPTILARNVAAPPIPGYLMLLIVAGLGVIYLAVRRMGKAQAPAAHTRRAAHPTRDDVILSDPAQAIQKLAESRDSQ